MLALPSQTPGLAARLGLTRAEADRSAWAIDAAGRRFEGAAAVNRALAELPGSWPRIAAAGSLPVLRQLERAVYRLTAGARGPLSTLLGAVPECADPAVDCGQG